MEDLGPQLPGTPPTLSAPAPAAKEVKVKRSAPRQKPAAREAQAEATEREYEITLHDSKEIPPNGQFIGVNGRQYILKPGIRVRVPASVLEVLNNAVHALPEINDKMQIEGMRNAPRLAYTLHPDA